MKQSKFFAALKQKDDNKDIKSKQSSKIENHQSNRDNSQYMLNSSNSQDEEESMEYELEENEILKLFGVEKEMFSMIESENR